MTSRMFLIFITIFLLQQCLSRVFQTSLKFSNFGKNDGWLYLDKMSFAPGAVQFRIRTEPKGIPYGAGDYVTIEAIPDYMWQHQKQRKCQDVPKKPFLKHKVTVAQSSVDYARQIFDIEQTTLYYFVMKDCLKSLRAEYQNNNLSLNIRLHLLNNDKEVGQQQDHWYIIPLIFCAGVWLVYFYNGKLRGAQIKSQWHKIMMFAGIACQISSLTWKTFGFLIYIYTGSDYGFFHFIYLLMHSISQSLVIGLVVMVGFGWTINFLKTKNDDLYFPILGCMALLNAVLTLLTKIQYNEHDRHHIFDTVSGHIIIGYRLLILLIFLIAIVNTYQVSRAKVKRFVAVFGLFGGLYVSALPIIIFIGNNWVQAKDRHEFVFVAMQTLKCATNIGLSVMLNSEKSYYNQISYQKRSFMPQQSKYF